MDSYELNTYINSAVKSLVKNAIKLTDLNPRETAFLTKYSCFSSKKSYKLRAKSFKAGTHIPAFLIASITTKCNLFCKGCYARANHICSEADAGVMLSDARWGELFDEAAKIGVSFVLLAGGEPLLRKEVIKRAAKIHDIIFPIFTNGTMIDEDYINLFRKNRNLIPVLSLEGKEERTDDRRGTGTYQKIFDTMNRLNSARLLYGTSITVTTDNVKEVSSEPFIEQLHKSGCSIVFYVEYVPVAENTQHLAPTDKERSFLEMQQEMLRAKYKDMMFLSFPGDEKYTGGCLAAGRGFFHISPYGNAEPCPFSPYSDTNVKTHSLIDALQSPLFEKLKLMELVGGEHDGGCSLFAHKEEVERLCGRRESAKDC